jgi:hypothetical protein
VPSATYPIWVASLSATLQVMSKPVEPKLQVAEVSMDALLVSIFMKHLLVLSMASVLTVLTLYSSVKVVLAWLVPSEAPKP